MHWFSIPRPLMLLASECIAHLHFEGANAALQSIPLYRFNNGKQPENNTGWALQFFNLHYQQTEPASPVCYAASPELRDEFKQDIPAVNFITSEAIFHYVYAVLHHPAYRKKCRLNVQDEFLPIPLYDNFQQWENRGRRLMHMHSNYQTVAPYPLETKEVAAKEHPKTKLRALQNEGIVQLDENTELHGVPQAVWQYKLGNRSVVECIFDQYKQKKHAGTTSAEHGSGDCFADDKEALTDLLKRVCTVSVETLRIINEMP